MSIYLIDYENVHSAGLEGVENLTIDDEVVMFYGNDGSSIPMDIHVKMAESKASIRYIRTNKTAKNYLDFQLSAISGYLVATTRQTDFIVISKDSGFNSVLDLWNNQDFVGRHLTFSKRDQIAEKSSAKKRKSSGRKKTDTASKKADTAALKTEETVESPVVETVAAEAAPAPKKMSSGRKSSTKKKSAAKTTEASKAKDEINQASEEEKSETRLEKNIDKKALRECVKDLNLKPQDYTKLYKVFQSSPDKNVYNMDLNKIYKDQDKANAIYKATRKAFEKQL